MSAERLRAPRFGPTSINAIFAPHWDPCWMMRWNAVIIRKADSSRLWHRGYASESLSSNLDNPRSPGSSPSVVVIVSMCGVAMSPVPFMMGRSAPYIVSGCHDLQTSMPGGRQGRSCLAVKSSGIQDLNVICECIETNRCIAVVVTVHDRVHEQFPECPFRIICGFCSEASIK